MTIYAGVLTGGTNNHETTSEQANYFATDFVDEGVVGAITNTSGVSPMTGGLAVNAQGTPNMTVAVSSGVAYVQATPSGQNSQVLRVYNNATANVNISANSSGSTKYDWIYLAVDATNAANPSVAGDNVGSLVTSRSSSSSSDDGTPPAYGYPIAVVTVANGASSITNANIADVRTRAGTIARASSILPYQFSGQSSDSRASWAWASYTPTWTNLTIGNGTVTARYDRTGSRIRGFVHITWGSTTSVSGSVSVSLPVTATATRGVGQVLGRTKLYNGATSFHGPLIQGSTTTGVIRWFQVSGSGIIESNISASSPDSWNTGDEFHIDFDYEAA